MIFYLLLNIFISALVTVTILVFHDRFTPPPDCSTVETAQADQPGALEIKIQSIRGIGSLESELVIIQNDGDEAVAMKGWIIKEGQGTGFVFPEITLYPGGSIQVHSGQGVDSASDLFWGRSEPAWKSGDLAALYDTHSIARAFYRIP